MEEKNNSVFEKSIDFIGVLRKCWIYIILVALVFALVAAVYTSLFVSKTYSSTVKFYVVIDRTSAHYLNTELEAAQALIDSYSVVVKNSDSFLRKVAEQSGLSYTPSQLRSMISVSSIGSEAFSVKVTSIDPQISYNIARVIEDIGPIEMINFVEAGNVKVLNPPLLSLNPDSPNIVRTVMVAAFFGAALVYGAFVILSIFDTRIHSEDDLRRFDIPFLGSVPTMETDSASKKRLSKNEHFETKS
ncbi:MAG: hypothetical protein E7587_01450 [Ruminococcaceae bacterium]|nr:hypothetical protein [Oscillospiraceae bacterium]